MISKETLLASAMSSAMLPVVSMTKHSTEELVTPISLQEDEGDGNTGLPDAANCGSLVSASHKDTDQRQQRKKC